MIVFLTGVTGLLGSHTALALLAAGHRVVALAREKNGISADRRVKGILAAHPGLEGSPGLFSCLTVLEGDLALPACGLGPDELELLTGGVDVLVHCAASVAFTQEDDGESLGINVAGAANAADLARLLGCRRLIHVSTAYVDGALRGEGFRSGYERSKLQGENLMLDLGKNQGVEVKVVRPSIITGDRVHGFTPTYHGIYPFLRFAAQYGGLLRRVKPSQWLPGDLYLKEKVNLVPADHVAAVIRALAESPAMDDAVFNVVNPNPWQVRELVDIVAGYYGIKEDTTESAAYISTKVSDSVVAAYDKLMSVYLPYFNSGLSLDTAAAERLVSAAGIPRVANTPDWIRALIRWGIRRKWKELP